MELIKTEQVFLNQDFSSQDEVMKFLAQAAVAAGITTNQTEVYQKLWEREQESTTGMMDGFAIPHAKANSIGQADIIIVRLNQGIDWKSLDGSPTEFIIALFIPDSEAGTTHLQLLSQVARLLMRKEVTEGLKSAQSQQEIAALLNEKLA